MLSNIQKQEPAAVQVPAGDDTPDASRDEEQMPKLLGNEKLPMHKDAAVHFTEETEEDLENGFGKSSPTRMQDGDVSVRSGRTGKTSFWSKYESQSFMSEDEEDGLEKTSWCCSLSCSGGGCCHCCYILSFLLFLIIFPLFLRWMLTAPKPPEFWHQEFPKFPLLGNWPFVRDDIGASYEMTMSAIPTYPSGCNHSCATQGGAISAGAEMNFDVTLELQAPGFQHTAYPVLLASNDFEEWWVAADRRHAYPRQYFTSTGTHSGEQFTYLTEKCTRPPAMSPSMSALEFRSERPSEVPTYVLACVTWTSTKVEKHQRSKTMQRNEMSELCDAVGGVCGWPGKHGETPTSIPGCGANEKIMVDNVLGKVGGVVIPNAAFSGLVSLQACMPNSRKCIASTQRFSRWPLHKCHNGSDSEVLHYDSLPRMQVVLENISFHVNRPDTMAPQAYIFTTPVSANGLSAEGLSADGVWKKLYDYDIFPLPVPLNEVPEPGPLKPLWERSLSTPPPPTILDEARHSMKFRNANKVTIKPNWCFGERGPLYLVACAVNTSTHLDKFAFEPGQPVAPPPFNDRCMTVTGRCAYACTEDQQPMLHCDAATGQITQSELVDKAETKDNRITQVYLFVWTLIFGFAVRVLSYFPGLFVPYKRAEYYTPNMTQELKYIAVCTPSGGETKACVLRNLVGAISTLPSDCQCSFHVLYADEGHRHPHKIMFRAFVAILAYIPDACLIPERKSKHLKMGFKEKNLKAFTSRWVESTKKFKLEECSTEKLAKSIEKLRDQLPASADKISKLEAQIDALSGVTALRILQSEAGWPKAEEGPTGSLGMLMFELEAAIMQMRRELTCGEKAFDGTSTSEGSARDTRVPVHLDDHADYGWTDPLASQSYARPLYNLHYVARAKPPEDERKLKVQHVAQGTWYYAIPKDEDALDGKSWIEWRQNAREFVAGDSLVSSNKYLVPVRTSRGKAGGLNFAENYLFDFHCRFEDPRAVMDPVRFKHSLFSIADARHQYQPDFFIKTIPYFFRSGGSAEEVPELNRRVAFTQCPQFFQEMPDESDYLDTNNSNFFRLGCMLRNCCGGVSSCGTNGTWLVRDRRGGRSGTNTMWEIEAAKEMDQGFTQTVERRFFHESCKVEDTASSLDRVVKGKYSQYINMRLSYGMAKAPTDYLAAIQRWAEGGVVLSYQTFLGTEQGVYMIWLTLLIFLGFIVSVFFAVHGNGRPILLSSLFRLITGDDSIMEGLEQLTGSWGYHVLNVLDQPVSSLEAFEDMFFSVLMWVITLMIGITVISIATFLSYLAHHNTCCGARNPARRTRFPICLAQWARLAITVDNLTYFMWFWTAFFWIGFNYYSVFAVKMFHFEPTGMTIFSWAVTCLFWCLILSASARNTKEESAAANEVFFLSLTNIWRTTQLFYITAPLTVYSILMGSLDFSRNRMFGEDISYWVGGDRGAVSKSIVQWWTLLLLGGTVGTWIAFFARLLPGGGGNVASVLIVTFIGLDVLHPCAFLWLGCDMDTLPKAEAITATGLSGACQKCFKRGVQLLLSMSFWKNCARSFIFSPRFTGCIKWIGPLQHAILPIITYFFPFLGINNVLLLLAATK